MKPSYYFRKFELGRQKKTTHKKNCAIWLVAAIWQAEKTWAQWGHHQPALLGTEPGGDGPGEQELLLGTDALSSTKPAKSEEKAGEPSCLSSSSCWEGTAAPGRNAENSRFPLGHRCSPGLTTRE